MSAGSGREKRAVAAQVAGRMTREAWVEAGVAALVEEGIANVKIQTIAKRLAVSRSSFYWFFADLQDLQKELLAYWLCKNTSPIIERALRPASTVTGAVCHIFECWVDPALFDPRLDAAVRSWGQVDTAIRQAVDQADEQRVEALTRMFSRYGYAGGAGLHQTAGDAGAVADSVKALDGGHEFIVNKKLAGVEFHLDTVKQRILAV